MVNSNYMDVYITYFSIGRIPPTLLSFLIFCFFCFRIKKGDRSSFWFASYFGSLFLFNFGYLVGYSVYNSMGTWGWVFACFIVFSALSRLQISYVFPTEVFPRERNWVLWIGIFLSVFAFLEYLFQFSNSIGFSFSLHAYGSKTKSFLIPAFSLMFYFASILVSLRKRFGMGKTTSLEMGPETLDPKDKTITLSLVFLTLAELILTGLYFLGHTRSLSLTFLADIMNSGILIIFCGYVLLYTSSLAGRTGFIPRLLGMCLIFFLLSFHLILRVYEREIWQFLPSKIQSSSREDLKFIWKEEEKLQKSPPLIPNTFMNREGIPEIWFWESSGIRYAILFDKIKDQYEVYPYENFRRELHNTLFPFFLLEIFLICLLLACFPYFFRKSFLLPMEQLVQQIEAEIQTGKPQKNKFGMETFEGRTLRQMFLRMGKLIQSAKQVLPEVSEPLDFLESYVNLTPKMISLGSQSLVYKSQSFETTIQEIYRASLYPHPVIITGETGSGKELAAKMIHLVSDRKTGPFVPVNCATLPESLWDAEIFGAKKGSFTDAKNDRKGRIEEAESGSLFFDEIGEMPLPIQAKMLRLLQERTFVPLGSNQELQANCRFIFATNQNLAELVQKKLFREDLLYRIQVFRIHLSPLRERKEDIPYLWDFFLRSFCEEYKREKPEMGTDAVQAILRYSWPGNIRELQNAVIRILSQTSHSPILARDLSVAGILPDVGDPSQTLPTAWIRNLEDELSFLARQRIEEALQFEKGNITRAAERLGLKRTTLRYKMKELGIRE